MARIKSASAAVLALASLALAAPDHQAGQQPSAASGYGNYGNFGPSTNWDSSYQDSLAEIQKAYDSMNNMFAGDAGSAPEGASYGNEYDANYNPLTPFNPYGAGEPAGYAVPEGYQSPETNYAQPEPAYLQESAFAQPESYNDPYANPYNTYDAYGQQSTYGASSQAGYGAPPTYGGGSPQSSYGAPPTYGGSSYGAPPQQNAYPPNAYQPQPSTYGGSDGEASAYGNGMMIDQQTPNIQEDCWKNITDRINGFFGDRFPTLPNGQSAYTDIEILSCYGCWCNRDERFGNGMGEPRDAFDAICKFHHQAYECIEIDAEDRSEVCDPVTISQEGFRFKMELSFDQGRGGMNLQCDQNQSWCKQRVCEADLQYIKDFVRTALAGHRVRRDLFGHEDHIGSDGLPTGYFDQKLECPLGGSLHTPHKRCCGAYPRRRVFKTDTLEDDSSSYRRCCDLETGDNIGATDGAVYYPSTQICCGEQGVQNGDQCELYNAIL